MNLSKSKKVMFVFLLLIACKMQNKEEVNANRKELDITSELKKPDSAERIINEAIEAHGGSLYDDAFYGFTFRNKKYTFDNRIGYRYSVESLNKQGEKVEDVLENGRFSRLVNDAPVELTDKDVSKYSQALNSVIYFATLPHKLQDKAVFKKYIGETQIKNQDYEVVEVTFNPNGGGQDFEDKFYYWLNKKTNTMDYLAYRYQVNDGGVRFRSAFNRRNVDGIIFQDYVNWEAPVGTPLMNLPKLYEKGSLKELSRILTEEVKNLK